MNFEGRYVPWYSRQYSIRAQNKRREDTNSLSTEPSDVGVRLEAQTDGQVVGCKKPETGSLVTSCLSNIDTRWTSDESCTYRRCQSPLTQAIENDSDVDQELCDIFSKAEPGPLDLPMFTSKLISAHEDLIFCPVSMNPARMPSKYQRTSRNPADVARIRETKSIYPTVLDDAHIRGAPNSSMALKKRRVYSIDEEKLPLKKRRHVIYSETNTEVVKFDQYKPHMKDHIISNACITIIANKCKKRKHTDDDLPDDISYQGQNKVKMSKPEDNGVALRPSFSFQG